VFIIQCLSYRDQHSSDHLSLADTGCSVHSSTDTSNCIVLLKSISNINGESHILYDLLMTYLKSKRSLTHGLSHLDDLRKTYKTNNDLVWQFENKEASAVVRIYLPCLCVSPRHREER